MRRQQILTACLLRSLLSFQFKERKEKKQHKNITTSIMIAKLRQQRDTFEEIKRKSLNTPENQRSTPSIITSIYSEPYRHLTNVCQCFLSNATVPSTQPQRQTDIQEKHCKNSPSSLRLKILFLFCVFKLRKTLIFCVPSDFKTGSQPRTSTLKQTHFILIVFCWCFFFFLNVENRFS